MPALIANLDYSNSEVRRYAAIALGEIGPNANQAVPSLEKELLTDTSVHPRRAAAEALAKIGDTSAIPTLVEVLDDSDIAIQAAEAVGVLAKQDFPDLGGPGYELNEEHVPLIVIAARKWWEAEGQYQEWSQP